MAIYRSKETIQAEEYDGTAASVERIMDMLGRTVGINNTPDYLLLDGMIVLKGKFISIDPAVKRGWSVNSKEVFESVYEKLDQ